MLLTCYRYVEMTVTKSLASSFLIDTQSILIQQMLSVQFWQTSQLTSDSQVDALPYMAAMARGVVWSLSTAFTWQLATLISICGSNRIFPASATNVCSQDHLAYLLADLLSKLITICKVRLIFTKCMSEKSDAVATLMRGWRGGATVGRRTSGHVGSIPGRGVAA